MLPQLRQLYGRRSEHVNGAPLSLLFDQLGKDVPASAQDALASSTLDEPAGVLLASCVAVRRIGALRRLPLPAPPDVVLAGPVRGMNERMARWVWTALPLLLLGSTPARAEQRPWLERFDVVSGCPDRVVFEQAVERRVARPLGVAFAELRIGVSIESAAAPSAQRLIGRLEVTDAAGFSSSRELGASSCPQLLEALSLLAAVSADAARTLHDAPLSTPATKGSAVGPDAMAFRAAEQSQDIGTDSPAPPEAVQLGPSFYALLQNVATPQPELGLGLALSVAWPSRGYWAPWLQVGGYRVQSGERSVGAAGIRARFDLIAAHAIACPVRLLAGGMGSLRPCVELDVGQLGGEGNGSAVLRNTDREGLWLSSALSLRGEIRPWAPLSLGASIGAVLPWTRHEFFFAPDMVAFRVPALGFRSTLSAGLTF